MSLRRFALILSGLALAFAFALAGRWQWGRALEKERLQAESAQALASAHPADLAWALAQPDGLPRWAAGRGHFLGGAELLLDNQRRGNAVGLRVYRLFQPDAGGAAVLVDLGFVDLQGKRQLPQPLQLAGESRSLRGLVDRPPSAGLSLGPALQVVDPRRWLLVRLDLGELSSALRLTLAPQVLRLDPALPLGYPRDLDSLPNTLTPERHRGYAVQWFGLSLATVIVTALMALRRPRP